MDAYVEPHLRWRLLTADDMPAAEAFRAQLEALDNSVLSGMTATIIDRALEPAEGLSIGGWDDYDSLSAVGAAFVAETDPLKVYLIGGVHPVHRHMLVGTSLLRWQVEGAEAWRDANHPGRPLWLGCYAEVGRPGLAGVAARQGFEPERYYYDLHRDLTRPLRVPTADGISIEAFRPGDAEAVRELHNLCFTPIGGAEVGAEQWHAHLAEPSFRPEWSFVAREDGRIVGYGMSVLEVGATGIGWTERFGVHPGYRGRGISLALLGNCLAAMRDAGCTEAGIGIDTPDGLGLARLRSVLGYSQRDAVALLSRVL